MHSLNGVGLKGDSAHRIFGPTDVYDLKRLFALPGLGGGQIITGLHSYYSQVQGMDNEQAKMAVSNQFNNLMKMGIIDHRSLQ